MRPKKYYLNWVPGPNKVLGYGPPFCTVPEITENRSAIREEQKAQRRRHTKRTQSHLP